MDRLSAPVSGREERLISRGSDSFHVSAVTNTFEQLIEQAQEPLPSHEFTLTEIFNDLIEESLTRGMDLIGLLAGAGCRHGSTACRPFHRRVGTALRLRGGAGLGRLHPVNAHAVARRRCRAQRRFSAHPAHSDGLPSRRCAAQLRLRPLLASKKVLVGREFYVFWQQELEAKREAFVLYSAPSPQTVTTQEVTLPLGHTMRIISDGKRPIGIEVLPP
jgi:hypothetical protein